MKRPPYRCLEDRLLANSVFDRDTGCRVWIGGTNKGKKGGGYPVLSMRNGKPYPIKVYAHRAAFELFHERSIRPGFTIDHTCENTLCIEPTHLEEVLDGENTRRRWGYERERAERFGDVDAA